MIEKEEKSLYLRCDICGKKIFWKKMTGLDLLGRTKDLLPGWTKYYKNNSFKKIICPDQKCQIQHKKNLEKESLFKTSEQNWTGTV